MIEIITANKAHIPFIEAIVKRKPRTEVAYDSPLYYLGCTVLNEYSLVAKRRSEVLGFLLAFQASAINYLWLHQITVKALEEEMSIKTRLLRKLEWNIKASWNNPIKSIKVALDPEDEESKKFYLRHKYTFTRNDKVLGKEIFQKRLIV